MAKYLEKKAKSLAKLNCNLASETARTTDCQNSCYSGFKGLIIKLKDIIILINIHVHVYIINYTGTNKVSC